MTAVILLFVTGALLLAAEIFLPGMIAGIVGTVALLIGSAMSFDRFGFMGGIAASSGALGLVILMLYLELIVIPRTSFGRKMVVQATVDSTSQPVPAVASEVVGKNAEALTTLAPSGYVNIDGRRYEAFCRSGHATKGSALRVVDVDNFRLIVTQLPTS
ncbi:MAG TPA: NfeD family protein [Candidatus Didemnitutus sp.]|nr:NfeD family protein [Candidatus Didemnitutus sp.]